MSRHLRLPILLACLLALPAIAAQGVTDSGNCPGPASESAPRAGAEEQSGSAAAPGSTAKAGGGGNANADDSAPRNRPRWQSFLPGMVR